MTRRAPQLGLILSTASIAILWAGCAGTTHLAVANPLESIAQPLAEAQPLQVVSEWPAGSVPAKAPTIHIEDVADGLTITGTHGQALNAATTLHRQLLELSIPNEIRCQVRGGQGKATKTRLKVMFPKKLTSDQRSKLAEVIAAFTGRAG